MSDKILYLVSLEVTKGNNIHENQILPFINNQKNKAIDVLFLIPLFLFSRKKKSINTKTYKNKSRVKEKYIPLLSYNSYMNWFVIPYFLIFTLPILILECRKKYKIIHTRSYTSGLLALIYKFFFDKKIKIIFDPRSTYPEEGVIIGRWKLNSISYKLWKFIEKIIIENSSAICCVSQGLIKHYSKVSEGRFEFIPAFVNEKFIFNKSKSIEFKKKYNIPEGYEVAVYLGSLGLWHGVKELVQLINFLKEKTNKKLKIFVLSSIDSKYFNSIEVQIMKIKPNEVPYFLSMCDYSFLPGVFDKSEQYNVLNHTMISSKIQESLVAGLKIIINKEIIEPVKYAKKIKGSIIYDFKNSSYQEIKLNDFNDCRKEVSKYYFELFSTKKGMDKYEMIYKEILCN